MTTLLVEMRPIRKVMMGDRHGKIVMDMFSVSSAIGHVLYDALRERNSECADIFLYNIN